MTAEVKSGDFLQIESMLYELDEFRNLVEDGEVIGYAIVAIGKEAKIHHHHSMWPEHKTLMIGALDLKKTALSQELLAEHMECILGL